MPIRPPIHKPNHYRTPKERKKMADADRPSAHKRGYDSKWRKARLVFLQNNPLCKTCLEKGVVEAATVVDHIISHKGDKKLFWRRSNWQALCKPCHDRKTALETFHQG